MTTPQPQGLPPQTFAEWLAQPVDWDVMGNPITRSMTLHGAYMSAAEYGWNAATEALRAHLEQSSQHPAPSPAQAVDADPLDDFQEGQWWIKELDSMVAEATPDQRRAVAVVHNLLRAASNTCQPQVQQGGSDAREALRLGVECLRNWKILHPEDFDELDERAVALLKAALATKERK